MSEIPIHVSDVQIELDNEQPFGVYRVDIDASTKAGKNVLLGPDALQTTDLTRHAVAIDELIGGKIRTILYPFTGNTAYFAVDRGKEGWFSISAKMEACSIPKILSDYDSQVLLKKKIINPAIETILGDIETVDSKALAEMKRYMDVNNHRPRLNYTRCKAPDDEISILLRQFEPHRDGDMKAFKTITELEKFSAFVSQEYADILSLADLVIAGRGGYHVRGGDLGAAIESMLKIYEKMQISNKSLL